MDQTSSIRCTQHDSIAYAMQPETPFSKQQTEYWCSAGKHMIIVVDNPDPTGSDFTIHFPSNDSTDATK